MRVEARSPANEIKASVILRRQNRRVLEWLLDPAGPLAGRAYVGAGLTRLLRPYVDHTSVWSAGAARRLLVPPGDGADG